MKKEREIIIKVIENKKINYNRLAKFFAIKFGEKWFDNKEHKCFNKDET